LNINIREIHPFLSGKLWNPFSFFFPGLWNQWPTMAKALIKIEIFANKIEEYAQILKPLKFETYVIIR
jgi:hypothetical protein